MGFEISNEDIQDIKTAAEAIQAKTDNLPDSPADEDTSQAIKAKTDLIGAASNQQVLTVNVTSAANAGDVTIATVSVAAVSIKKVVVKSNGNTTSDLTSVGAYGGASKVVTFIPSVVGVQSNLDAEDKQVESDPVDVSLGVGKTVVLTLTGTGGTAVDLDVIIHYAPEDTGGTIS